MTTSDRLVETGLKLTVTKAQQRTLSEFYAEMVQVTPDKPHTAAIWKNDLKAFDQWEFRKFVVEPPDWGPRKKQ